MEATKMSIDRWMDKEVVVYKHNGILLSRKKECIWVSSNEVDEPRTYYTQRVKWSCSVVSDSLRPHGLLAYQDPPSMGFSRQECWSGLPFPSPGDLPNPGIEPGYPALQADVLPSEPPGKPCYKRSQGNALYVNTLYISHSAEHSWELNFPLLGTDGLSTCSSATHVRPLCVFQKKSGLGICFEKGRHLFSVSSRCLKATF